MTLKEITIESDELDSCTVIRLKGVLNFENCTELKRVIEYLVENSKLKIVLDLSELKFVDSAGLGTVVGAKVRLSQANGLLRLGGANNDILEVLRRSRLIRLFDIRDTVDEAVSGAWS